MRLGIWLDQLLRRFGLVRLGQYGLLVTPDDRIMSTRPTVLDDGIGGKIVGWRETDLAAMELDRWPAAAKLVKNGGRPLVTQPLPTIAMPPMAFVLEGPRTVDLGPRPESGRRSDRSPKPEAPGPVSMPWPVAAPAPMVVARPAVVAPAPVPAVAPDPGVEEDEWEWEIAMARARAAAEAIEAPAPPRRLPRATGPVEDKPARAQPRPVEPAMRTQPRPNRLEDTIRTHAQVTNRLEDTIRTQPAANDTHPQRVPYRPYRLPGVAPRDTAVTPLPRVVGRR